MPIVLPKNKLLMPERRSKMFIINQHLGGGIDPDAQTLITAMGLPNDSTVFYEGTSYERTGAQLCSYINTFFLSLKSHNLYDKLKAFYLFIGGTAAYHKWNGKDPRDLDDAFRLTFNGGLTHSATGILPNGSSGFANTYFNPFTNLPNNDSVHMSFYSRTNIEGWYADMGVIGSSDLILWGLCPGNVYYYAINATQHTTIDLDSRALYIGNRVGSIYASLYRNGTKISFLDEIPLTRPNGVINIFKVSGYYCPRECCFNSVGEGFTDEEEANFYNAIQTLETSLGRQV